MTAAHKDESVQRRNLIRWLVYLPAPWRIALKLVLLAAALPLLYHGMRHSNPLTGALGALFFAALWLYHGMTGSFGHSNGASTYSVNPANGEAIIPGTDGLSSSGKYTGSDR